jgi:hypothetical protein
MTDSDVNYYYLRTDAPGAEPRRYLSLDGAMSAMSDIIQFQRERGFNMRRHPDGKRTCQHPDGRIVQLWVEDERGDVVS